MQSATARAWGQTDRVLEVLASAERRLPTSGDSDGVTRADVPHRAFAALAGIEGAEAGESHAGALAQGKLHGGVGRIEHLGNHTLAQARLPGNTTDKLGFIHGHSKFLQKPMI